MKYFIYNDQSLENFVEVEHSSNVDAPINSYVMSSIEKNLTVWVSERRYMQRSITINMVAKEIATNRTYLSKYINTTYKCTFKSWITQLRLKEAKEMLVNDFETPINIIATSIGFASVESFTHIFTRIEGRSPSRWREEYIEQNDIEIQHTEQ